MGTKFQDTKFDELQYRLDMLENMQLNKNINSAFGSVRTTQPTTLAPTTTKRPLTKCEKRSISENNRCKGWLLSLPLV